MMNCTSFPDYEKFVTAISEPSIQVYNECKNLFNERMNLPVDHEDKWTSFVDYLKFYNMSDVRPTAYALINQFGSFYKSFGISPFYYLTLPSYSKFAMFSLYDENSSNIFTLPDKNSVKIFRENIIGGLVNVYKRCIHIGSEDEKFPLRARKNIESK